MKKIKIDRNISLQLKTSKKIMRCVERPDSLILVEKIVDIINPTIKKLKIKKGDYLIHFKTSMDGGNLYVIDEEAFKEKLIRVG